jgi:hypothetical protein
MFSKLKEHVKGQNPKNETMLFEGIANGQT